MKSQKLLLVGAVCASLIAMTSGSTRLAIPLVPVAVYYSVTQHWPYLVGAGLAGAALLKLKGAATVGTYLYLRDRGVVDVDFDHNHAGWDSRMARGYGGRYGARYKREVDGSAADGNAVTGISFNPSLDEVLSYDELGCGLRLVCELASIPRANLQEDEAIILALFGGEDKLPNPYSATRGKLSYAYAALLGKSSANARVCSHVYNKCPHAGKQIMGALRSASV